MNNHGFNNTINNHGFGRHQNAGRIHTYNVYNFEALQSRLNAVEEQSEELLNFYKNFNFENILKDNLAKSNSVYVFKNVIKEDTTKSKITQALNKLHQQNLSKIISNIREITFKSMEELNELVSQCIQKIKKDNEQIKPLVAALCYELLSTYFTASNGEKIYFRRLLLTAVKNDYVESINYENDDWSKDKSEKSMILIGTLYNSKIIDNNIMIKIFSDLKMKIKFKPEEDEVYYENVEKAIQNLSFLVSIINIHDSNNNIYDGLDIYLEQEMEHYEVEKHRLSRKVRLVCKNIIDDIRKTVKN